MPQTNATLMPLADKLQRRGSLPAPDVEAILALPHSGRSFRDGEYLVRQGGTPDRCLVLLSGWASRHRTTADGKRQILGLHVKGDVVDLQNALLDVAHDDVQAIGPVEAAMVPKEAIVELAFARPAVGKRLWADSLLDASIAREWTVNVGQRDARTRILHLLCEMHALQEEAGLADAENFELPLSQEQLGDATGLTAVHVNRTLQALRNEGLFEREKRSVRVLQRDAMASAGDFSATYMQAARETT